MSVLPVYGAIIGTLSFIIAVLNYLLRLKERKKSIHDEILNIENTLSLLRADINRVSDRIIATMNGHNNIHNLSIGDRRLINFAERQLDNYCNRHLMHLERACKLLFENKRVWPDFRRHFANDFNFVFDERQPASKYFKNKLSRFPKVMHLRGAFQN